MRQGGGIFHSNLTDGTAQLKARDRRTKVKYEYIGNPKVTENTTFLDGRLWLKYSLEKISQQEPKAT